MTGSERATESTAKEWSLGAARLIASRLDRRRVAEIVVRHFIFLAFHSCVRDSSIAAWLRRRNADWEEDFDSQVSQWSVEPNYRYGFHSWLCLSIRAS